jgi:hypothetical protein
MAEENETLRWPTNLDRDAIVQRLVKVREAATKSGHPALAALYEGIEDMPSSKIGAKVIAGMNLVQEDPERQAIAQQLAMVAMNLKNLKN